MLFFDDYQNYILIHLKRCCSFQRVKVKITLSNRNDEMILYEHFIITKKYCIKLIYKNIIYLNVIITIYQFLICLFNIYKHKRLPIMQKKELPNKTEQQQKMERIAQFQTYFKDLDGKFQQMTKQVNQMPKNIEIFRNHQLPLARIKKIMKSDEDVRMISSQTPVLFAKACQIFITQLTYRAWAFTLQSKRRTLQKSDVSACIYHTQIFDFLIDIIPKEDMKLLKKTTPDNVFQILQNQQVSRQQKKNSGEEVQSAILNNK